MENHSRVKKYEDLRNQIDNNTHESYDQHGDPTIFKRMDISEEAPRREREIHVRNDSDTFINEYMDDLIRDVKQYNRDKGLLNSDITEVDILNQLKNPTRLKRENYIKTIEEAPKVDENTIMQSKKEIAMQIQELLNENANDGMMVSKVKPVQDAIHVTEVPKKQQVYKVPEVHNTPEIIPTFEHEKNLMHLNEQTQQMKIKIDQQEEELNDLSQGIDKTNKLLNVILFFLVVALLAVIGVTVYMILKNGGKI